MNILPVLLDNPILLRELRRRMRGRALLFAMSAYIVIMTIIALTIMVAMTPHQDFDIQDVSSGKNFLEQMVRCGRTIFTWITGIQLLLVLIIAPTVTAGMTTAEKERQTFDFLKVTTIHPWSYILGSFLSTVFYVTLALLCALPPLSLCFLFGGVAPSDVVFSFLTLLAGSCVLSAFGLYISSVRERTRSAQGVVVFVIFLIVFGGMQLKRTLALYFGGPGLGAGAGGAAAGMYLFGIAITPGMLIALGTIFLTAIFLLLAARKLYRSDERAFTYWQFALLFALVMGAQIGLSWSSALSDQMVFWYGVISAALLATAAVCFGVGRMEVGDEMWHIKRLVPAFRPVDESLLFLAATGGLWLLATRSWAGAASAGAPPAPVLNAFFLVTLSSFAFFIFLGRGLTAVFLSRAVAGRGTLAAIGFFWAVLPLLGYLLGVVSSYFDGASMMIERFSPVFIILEHVRERGTARPTLFAGSGFLAPGVFQAAVYSGLAIVAACWGEVRRWRRFHDLNYHFDMPEFGS